MARSSDSTAARPREYLFDNCKALLILLVVIGHFVEPSSEFQDNPLLYDIKWGIYSFHMPAFVFISGYFSKKKASLRKLFGSIAIPYFTYEILYYLLYLLLDKETGLYFARPKFSLWYLMALFFWRLLSPVILKIPGHMLLMTVAGLLIGCSELDNFLSIPRILYFFPFFLAGLHFDSSLLYRLRTPGKRLISLGLLGGYLVFLFTDNFHRNLTPWIFYGRYSYHDMGLSAPEGAAIRLLCYAFSFLLLFLLLLVLPDSPSRFSVLGERTLAIYICHGYVFSILRYGTGLLDNVRGLPESLFLLAFCVVLVWILSRPVFSRITGRIAHLPEFFRSFSARAQ
ncbi:MAG TPA: acyltransferase family protein [Candidatus Pullilachnospira stercoravium]|uniref:Acyltransferase family protein n=1 Tax=Candidatus Pullilachnospira stercoravium TaxID=2840913 RepID=A0A9D1NWZ9_9FIRM|nr:acyltransferase family protein [Candidatus Pullilachnospira stercoravium]